MGRPRGSKNKVTILREAHRARIDALREPEIIDALHIIERAARHFFIRAEMGVNARRKQSDIDEDYKQAAALARIGLSRPQRARRYTFPSRKRLLLRQRCVPSADASVPPSPILAASARSFRPRGACLWSGGHSHRSDR